MDKEDLSIYTVQDLEQLLASVTEARRLTQRAVGPLPEIQISLALQLQIQDLDRKIERYRAELGRRGVGHLAGESVKILFLSANPNDAQRLETDEEIAKIQRLLRTAEYRDQFELVPEMAVRVSEIPEHLLRHRPTIVHFGGHADRGGSLIAEGGARSGQVIPQDALAALFSVLKNGIRCVVLNACYAAEQARLIAAHIECTVGMTGAVYDQSAVAFSEGFYRGLAWGKSVKESFDLGCIEIQIQGHSGHALPVLYASDGVNPAMVVLTAPRD